MRTIPYKKLFNKLKELQIFSKMDESFLSHFISLTELRFFEANEVVVREGEFEDGCGVILSGEIGVLLLRKDHSHVEVATLGRNEFFGEIATISGHKRTAMIQCNTETEILFVNRKALFFWMDNSSDFKEKVYARYSERLLETELQKVSVFKGQNKEFFAELKEYSEVVDFQKDEKVLDYGDEYSDLYIIINGFAKVLVHEDRRENTEYSSEFTSVNESNHSTQRGLKSITAAYLSSGNYFGEIAPSKDVKRGVSVVTLTRMELIRIDGRKYKSLIERYFDCSDLINKVISARSGNSIKVQGDMEYQKLLDWVISSEIIHSDAVLFVDMHKCIRCESCIKACKTLYGASRLSLSGFQFNNILVPSSCRHCNDPVCLEGCPTGAIDRDYTGEVFHKNNCIGCGNCARKCPYDNIFMVPLVEIKKTHIILDFFNKDFLFKKNKANDKRGVQVKVELEDDSSLPQPQSKTVYQREVKTVATKCDLCKNYPFSGCVQSCPRGAITKVRPREYFSELTV